MKNMRIYNYERYENIQLWKIWECKNYERYENAQIMKSIFLSQKCMEFSNSSFFCSEVYEVFEFKICCPSSVVSVVVVVLRPSSVPSVRPSSVVVPYLQIQGRMQIFNKKRRNKCREYEIRIELEIWKSIAGGKLLCVLKKLVLRPKHFCFRILAPMSILTFWILYIMMIK